MVTNRESEITKFKKFIGLKAETEYDSKINRQLKKIEAEFKTVEGVVFKNLKDVKAAKADIQKFYEYIAVNGIGSETIIEDVRALDFKTKIITDNLEERINKMTDEAEAMSALDADAVDDVSALASKYDSNETNSRVDDELAALKAQLGK